MPDDNWRWVDHVRAIAHEYNFHGPLSDKEIEHILWEQTAWPIAGPGYVEEQLRDIFDPNREPKPNGPLVC